MTRILAPEPPGAARTLEAVLDRAVGDAVPPTAVVLEDRTGAWLGTLASLGPRERAGTVAVVLGEAGAVAAAALGVGGAAWWPVGTPALEAAVRAAAAAAVPEGALPAGAGRALLEASEGGLLEIGHRRRSFWRHQLGEPELRFRLAGALRELGREAVLVEGPVALADRETVRELLDRWMEHPGGASIVRTEGIAVADLPGGGGPPSGDPVARPVFALPSGDRVGAWAAGEDRTAPGAGWTAVPADTAGEGRSWRLGRGGGIVPEVLTAVQVENAAADGAPAVRVPGWLAVGLFRGTPSWLLVERLARAAAGGGVPLWVPNVGDASLRLLMTLQVPLWVDGPAVPET